MKWYSIENKSNGKAEIKLYGYVGSWDGVTEESFMQDLDAIGNAKHIDLRVHSRGGSVFTGYLIHNLLKEHPAKITAHIDGLALSIMSYIITAADKIIMAENAKIMMHNPSVYMYGEENDLRVMADLLNSIKEDIIRGYMRRVNCKHKELVEMMDKTTYLSAEQALEIGFINEVSGEIKAAACENEDPENAKEKTQEITIKDIPEKVFEIIKNKTQNESEIHSETSENDTLPGHFPFNKKEIANKHEIQKENNEMKPEDFKEMVNMFGADFAAEAFAEGKTLEQCKNEFIEKMKTENKTLSENIVSKDAEIANLKTKKETIQNELNELKNGSKPLDGDHNPIENFEGNGGGADKTENQETFADKVEAIAKAENCSKADAAIKAAEKFPELREKYINPEKK